MASREEVLARRARASDEQWRATERWQEQVDEQRQRRRRKRVHSGGAQSPPPASGEAPLDAPPWTETDDVLPPAVSQVAARPPAVPVAPVQPPPPPPPPPRAPLERPPPPRAPLERPPPLPREAAERAAAVQPPLTAAPRGARATTIFAPFAPFAEPPFAEPSAVGPPSPPRAARAWSAAIDALVDGEASTRQEVSALVREGVRRAAGERERVRDDAAADPLFAAWTDRAVVDELVDGAAATADEVDALLSLGARPRGSPRRAHFVDGDGHTHRVNPFMLSPVRRRAADRHAVSPPQRFGLSGGGGGLRFPSDDPYW